VKQEPAAAAAAADGGTAAAPAAPAAPAAAAAADMWDEFAEKAKQEEEKLQKQREEEEQVRPSIMLLHLESVTCHLLFVTSLWVSGWLLQKHIAVFWTAPGQPHILLHGCVLIC
jgi:hypothetical protein